MIEELEDDDGFGMASASMGDALCIHGGAAQTMPELLSKDSGDGALPPIVMGLVTHPMRDHHPVEGGGHTVTELKDTLFVLTVDDAAMMVAWIIQATIDGKTVHEFRESLVEAKTIVRGRAKGGSFKLMKATDADAREPRPPTSIGGYL